MLWQLQRGTTCAIRVIRALKALRADRAPRGFQLHEEVPSPQCSKTRGPTFGAPGAKVCLLELWDLQELWDHPDLSELCWLSPSVSWCCQRRHGGGQMGSDMCGGADREQMGLDHQQTSKAAWVDWDHFYLLLNPITPMCCPDCYQPNQFNLQNAWGNWNDNID